MAAHAKLSPSAAHRWMNCPGSIRLCEQVVKKTSIYAQEGTIAHYLAQECLTKNHNANLYNGWWGWDNLWKNETGIQEGRPADNGLFVIRIDEEMIEAVQAYLDYARSFGEQMFVEQKFQIHAGEEIDLWGTADLCIPDDLFSVLHVFDYKHGKGVPVDVEWNPQLMIYAYGALGSDHSIYDQVKLHVIQPRTPYSGAIKSWEISTKDLGTWVSENVLPAAEATLKSDAPLVSGDWCKFCDALPTCPEMEKRALESAQQSFTQVPAEVEKQLTLPVPEELQPEKLRQVLDFLNLFEPWAKAVRNLAHEKLAQGEHIPGYKMVKTKSQRKWADEKQAENTLMPVLESVYDMKIKSPAGAEKALKAEGWKKQDIKELLDKLVTTKEGQTIAPESDKRPALNPGNAFKDADLQDADFLN